MPTVAEAGRRKLFVLIWLLLFSIDEGRNPLFWVILGNPDLMNQQLMVSPPWPSHAAQRGAGTISVTAETRFGHLAADILEVASNEPYVWEMFCNLA